MKPEVKLVSLKLSKQAHLLLKMEAAGGGTFSQIVDALILRFLNPESRRVREFIAMSGKRATSQVEISRLKGGMRK